MPCRQENRIEVKLLQELYIRDCHPYSFTMVVMFFIVIYSLVAEILIRATIDIIILLLLLIIIIIIIITLFL